jgi:hypothetical protein
MKNNAIRQFTNGFGILEVVVASFVLIMIITSSVTLTRMAIKSSVLNLDRVQAYNLAEEGAEITRHIRDTGWINGQNLSSALANGQYKLVFNNNNWNLQSDTAGEPIVLDNKTYNRKIYIENVDGTVGGTALNTYLNTNLHIDNTTNSIMKKIRVEITWDEYNQTVANGNAWNYTLLTYLSDWKPQF